jgi:hypothetical protein
MAKINVKAEKGRVAFSAPRNGFRIPEDKFVPVEDTPYIRRLIEYHGDLVVESTKKSAKSDGGKPDNGKSVI